MTNTLLAILILEFIILAIAALYDGKLWLSLYFLMAAGLNYSVLMMGGK